MPNALVTGGTGFIGSALVKTLQESGWNVYVLVRDGHKEPKAQEGVYPKYYYGDMKSMMDIVKSSKPDVVFHLAAHFVAEHTRYDVEKLLRSNITLPTQLAEAMIENGVTKLVNTGTSWQHYKKLHLYQPQNLYAATKQATEDILKYYHDVKELSIITLKLFDTYGPNDSRGKLVSRLLDAAKSGESIALSPGEQQIDLLHVDDVARAFLTAGNHLFGIKAINDSFLLGGTRLTLQQLVANINQVTGRTISANWGAKPYRNREIMIPVLPYPLPTWEPKISLEEGLKMVYCNMVEA